VNEKHILRLLGLGGGFVFSLLFVMKVVVVMVSEIE
jgi:hypothetical protein